MKTLLKNILKGLCLSTNIVLVSTLLGGILSGDITSENIEGIVMYVILILWIGLFIGVGLTITERNKNIDFHKRQKILKNSSKILLSFILIFVIIFIVSIVKKYMLGIVMSILFITTLGLWLLGSILGYAFLKKDIELINQKLKEK